MPPGDGSGGDSIYGGKFNGEAAGGARLPGEAGGVCSRPPAAVAALPPPPPCPPGPHPPPSTPHPCPDEKPGLAKKHDAPGLLSMANSGKNSNSSQFFFTLAPAPQCDGKHVVFGRVLEGLEVLQRIGAGRRQRGPRGPPPPGGGTAAARPDARRAGPCPPSPLRADAEAASKDGTPRVDVTIADCGVLP
jgi:cyclophilin family peptidyl-prolyl cis-trans isomerase